MTIVDAHVHIWDADRVSYPWLDEAPTLDRRYGLADVRRSLELVGVDRIVLVQAADDDADTELMLAAAASDDVVAGVVAWAPLRDPRGVAERLDRWGDAPVVGLRHLVHRDRDPDLLDDPAVGRSLDLLGDRGLTFDVCAETIALLEKVPALADRHPGTRFVVDHLAKPPIATAGRQPWADALAEAARRPNVTAKVSGLNTAAAPGWSSADFVPYVEHALDCFGSERLMYGGDWPFALLAADSYEHVATATIGALERLSADERADVLGATATRVYSLSHPR